MMGNGKLQKLMKERKVKQYEIANALGISEASVSGKMLGKREWKLGEARKVAKLLKMEPSEIVNVFFD